MSTDLCYVPRCQCTDIAGGECEEKETDIVVFEKIFRTKSNNNVAPRSLAEALNIANTHAPSPHVVCGISIHENFGKREVRVLLSSAVVAQKHIDEYVKVSKKLVAIKSLYDIFLRSTTIGGSKCEKFVSNAVENLCDRLSCAEKEAEAQSIERQKAQEKVSFINSVCSCTPL